MCTDGDNAWLDDFYKRVMSGIDPLAQYDKFNRTPKHNSLRQNIPQHEKTVEKNSHNVLLNVIAAAAVLALCIYMIMTLN